MIMTNMIVDGHIRGQDRAAIVGVVVVVEGLIQGLARGQDLDRDPEGG